MPAAVARPRRAVALLLLLTPLGGCGSQSQYDRNQHAIDGELAVANMADRCAAARRPGAPASAKVGLTCSR